MIQVGWRRYYLCLVLALPLHASAAADVVDIDRVAQAPAEAWDEFLRTSDFDQAYSGYAVLDKIGYGVDGVDVELCRQHLSEIHDAVAKAPVSIAVVRGAMLCAEGMGDAVRAERLENALLALSREALRGGRQEPWPKPIRVLGPMDVYALLHVLGLESRYEYFDLLRPGRYFPQVVAAWDKDAGKESRYVFDYVDAVAALKGSNEYAGYPFYRHLLVDFFLDAQAGSRELAATDLQAVLAARSENDASEKVKALRITAGYGGIQSLRSWIAICATQPFKGCADGMADNLLSLAEKKQAVPMTLLAFVQAEGIGIQRDDELADQLLVAAMRLWSEEGVAIEYQQLASMADRPKALDRKVLQKAMQHPASLAMSAAYRIGSEEKKLLTTPELEALAAPASNRVGTGQAWLSEYWRQQDNTDSRIRAMQLAAEAGDAYAQGSYSFHLLSQKPAKIDQVQIQVQVQRWMREAAFGGRVEAMRHLAQQEIFRRNWKAADHWLMAGVRNNDIDAMMDLASLYERDHQEAGQSVKKAFEWYVMLADQVDVAGARRSAADLALRGKGTDKDPAKALGWLLKDAEAGDQQSQLRLAIAYFEGKFGADQRDKGTPWIERIMASENSDFKSGYAYWLFYRSHDPEREALGLRMWKDMHAAGQELATNNLAWALCTAVNPAMRDAKLGAELAEEMLKDPDLSAGSMDTVAACQAAIGDYPRAIETQRRAISIYKAYWGLGEDEGDEADEDGFASRLKLYQAGKPYIDDSKGDPEA